MVLGLTVLHGLIGNWSGIASLGNFLVAIAACPFLLVRAWQLRATVRTPGGERLRWLLIAGFPAVFLAFWVTVALVTGGVK